ncbi:MAG: M3 family oligoendopeptidase [Bacteroidota bacterium]
MQHLLEIRDHRNARTFLPKDFQITNWEHLKPIYEQLLAEEPDSVEALESFLRKRNELDSMVAEDYAWRYIRMTCATQDEALKERFQKMVQEIIPHISEYEDKLNRKILANPHFDALDGEKYVTYIRHLKREIELFREQNIPLAMKDKTTAQQYEVISGAMSIEHEGETLTLQQAAKLTESKDRNLRADIWLKMAERRYQDRSALEDTFDQLVTIRHEIAQNADYESFTRFKFDQMGRFDYSLQDTWAFHEAVEKVVVPAVNELHKERKRQLGLDVLRPWDLQVDYLGDKPLEPFREAGQLLSGSVKALSALRPELGQMIDLMDKNGFLDLDSRIGKAPGGYNYPLMETGVPFIFMNAAGTQSDVITMLHESGHAVHSFMTRDIPLNVLKHTPSEVAELASMAMELLCLDEYDAFYQEEAPLIRAKKEQLVRCITIFPWIATIDAFQQQMYDQPNLSKEERIEVWRGIYNRFHGDVVDWSGYEHIKDTLWLRQGHVFSVPFYYIEYAIAQLGALAIWRNFRKNPGKTLQQYLAALELGYTKPIPAIYETAGIQFDFSEQYMRDCVDDCLNAYRNLSVAV